MEAIPLPQLRLDEFIYELQEAPVEKIVVLLEIGEMGAYGSKILDPECQIQDDPKGGDRSAPPS